jgi:hypothetical protein
VPDYLRNLGDAWHISNSEDENSVNSECSIERYEISIWIKTIFVAAQNQK